MSGKMKLKGELEDSFEGDWAYLNGVDYDLLTINDTIKFFIKMGEFEKCASLEKIKQEFKNK